MPDTTIYYIAVVLVGAGFTILYQFRGASKDYLETGQEATYEAIKKAISYAKDTKDFFKMYETIHTHYTQMSNDADAYIRIAEGLIILAGVVALFNFIGESLQPYTVLYFLVLLVVIAYFFLNGTWGLLKRVLRAKPPRFEFRSKNGSVVLQVDKQQEITSQVTASVRKSITIDEAKQIALTHVANVRKDARNPTIALANLKDSNWEIQGSWDASHGEVASTMEFTIVVDAFSGAIKKDDFRQGSFTALIKRRH